MRRCSGREGRSMSMQEAARSRRMQDLQRKSMARNGLWPDSLGKYDASGRIREALHDVIRRGSRK